MNKIAVFGATGTTGLCVLKFAVEKGLSIRALVRNPAKVPQEYEETVDVVKGDVLNVENVNDTLKGQHAAIVLLGMGNILGPTTVMSKGLENIIGGMKSQNVDVVSVCLSVNLFAEPEKVQPMFPEIFAEHRKMYDSLKASGLKWIAVNAPLINNQPPSGYVTAHTAIKGLTSVSKYDLAKFFVDSVSMPEHYQKSVGIASNPRE
uniref:NAD(P)-binding domain-containing protein n=1 Tax=Graphocephala atropunctata TaxID=36148 RepID=A0A1B6MAT5_9HEMI